MRRGEVALVGVALLLAGLASGPSTTGGHERALMEFFKRHRPSRLRLRPKFPYPYDFLYAALLGSSPRPTVETAPRPENFSPTEGKPGTPEGAVADIVRAWMGGNPELVRRHLDPRVPVACYLKGAYSHLLSPDEFFEFTRLAMERLRTVSFKFRRPVEAGERKFSATGVHVFLDPDGKRRAVAVEFTFVRGTGGEWIIRAVNYGPAGERRKHKKCPISTVAFGPGSEEVALLLDFRDGCLMRSLAGRLAVRAYYLLAPPVARLAEHGPPPLRRAMRLSLRPLLWLAGEARRAEKSPPPGGPALAGT